MAAKPGGLGRGLGALIKDTPPAATAAPAAAGRPAEAAPTGARRLAVAQIHKSPWQPRHQFDQESLGELVQSVREHGVLQPLLVRKSGAGFELIAGERRLRAAQAAGLPDVPAIVMDVSDREALELALIENLQRSDLNLIEEAEGYRALAEKFSLTQEDIAARVGKARPTVANALRLLDLPVKVKQLIAERQLSPGHAKALLGLENTREQELLAARAVAEGLSVRQVEKVVARTRRGPRAARRVTSDIPEDHLKYVLEHLHQKLGTAVRLEPCKTLPNGRKAKGAIEIDFYSADDLDRILVILGIAGDL
jgi:ParB family chromosome partitioning protein